MENPVVIMLINMTIVFAVLFFLSIFIRVIHMIDPTNKPKKANPAAAPAPVAAPAPAPVAPAPVVEEGISDEVVAVIAASLAAYGVGFSSVKSIRPAARPGWASSARVGAMNK